jgi:hypothetical protein
LMRNPTPLSAATNSPTRRSGLVCTGREALAWRHS